MEAIRALIEAEHAAVLPELEAKIAEAKWETLTTPIDPHHLSTARRHLVRESTSSSKTPALPAVAEPLLFSCQPMRIAAAEKSRTQPNESDSFTPGT